MYTKILGVFLSMAATALTITGCIIVINGKSVQGSGKIIMQEREVAEFNKVLLKGSGKVFLTPGENVAEKKEILVMFLSK